MLRWFVVIVTGLLFGCTPGTPAPGPSEAPRDAKLAETPPAKEDPGPDPERWRCAADEDCTQTCALGAVSLAWLQAHPDADACDDGCGWKSGNQACRNGECVTLDEHGGIDESCTKRTKPLFE